MDFGPPYRKWYRVEFKLKLKEDRCKTVHICIKYNCKISTYILTKDIHTIYTYNSRSNCPLTCDLNFNISTPTLIIIKLQLYVYCMGK